MKTPTITELVEIFERSTTGELGFTCPEFSLSLKKPVATPPAAITSTHHVPVSRSEVNTGNISEQTKDPSLVTVTAPLVGIFYLTPAPDATPYVEKGSKISKGSTICAIEAMKLYNELTADYDCEIVSICAPQGSLVEFGQPLFEVRRI